MFFLFSKSLAALRTGYPLPLAVLLLVAGCNNTSSPAKPAQTGKTIYKQQKKVLTAKDVPGYGKKQRNTDDDASSESPSSTGERSPSRSSSSSRRGSGGEEQEMRRVISEIKQGLELGPTLVVWFFDSTPSAAGLVDSCRNSVSSFYRSTETTQLLAEGGEKLLTAMVDFDETVRFTLDPPSADGGEIEKALGASTPATGGREMPCTALRQALDKYLPLRTKQGKQVVFVLVTDEAGDDSDLVDKLASDLQRAAIPLYVLGVTAPWGQTNPFAGSGAASGKMAGDKDKKGPDDQPTYGPESFASERVHVPVPSSVGGFRITKGDLIDSGFGPFSLERLCRASGGTFVPVRPAGFSSFGQSMKWPTGQEKKFDPAVVSRYAPDYVSAKDYEKLLQTNKARFALHEAAKVGFAEILDNPALRFQKLANEAQMKVSLDEAQRQPAKVASQVDKLYAILQPGEADRDKLTSPRWQAEYDYAYGRVLAAKVRNDGYNQMIAALKNGKGPKDPPGNEYILEPADSYETGSALRKMAEKAKLFLDRVVEQHKGTPWAAMAAEDVQVPFGWKWQGS